MNNDKIFNLKNFVFFTGLLFVIGVFSACSQQADHESNQKSDKDSSTQANSNKIDSTHHFEQIKYSNGKVKMEGNVENGLREGKWTSFYEDGMIWSETNFSKGQKDGATTTWYPSGVKRYEGFYKQNRETGIWKFYDENGNLVQEKKYK